MSEESSHSMEDMLKHTILHNKKGNILTCKLYERLCLQKEYMEDAVDNFKKNLHSDVSCNSGYVAKHKNLRSSKKLYRCPLCSRVYRLQESLKIHIVLHIEEGLLVTDESEYPCKCILCAAEFSSRVDLMDHLSLHKDGTLLKCLICSRRYKNPIVFKKHMLVHKPEEALSRNSIRTSVLLRLWNQHLKMMRKKSENDVGPNLCCCLCKTGFVTTREYKRHLTEHFERTSFEDGCNQTCSDVDVHEGKSTAYSKVGNTSSDPSEKISLQCEVTQERLKTNGSLDKPKVLHFDVKPFTCHICSKTFFSYQDLRTHFANHSEGKFLFCSSCSEVHDFQDDLQEHNQSHFEDELLGFHLEKKLYHCNICKRVFKSSKYLKQHMSEDHSISGLFRCQFCKKPLKTKESVVEHSAFHSLNEFYTCLICKQRCEILDKLEQHMLVCSFDNEVFDVKNEKLLPESCAFATDEYSEDANNSFDETLFLQSTSSSNWEVLHPRSGSWKGTPYKCDLCPNKFDRRDQLTTHTLSHCNDKPYQCHFCFKFFRYYSNLRKHLHKHEHSKGHKCSLCPAVFSSKGALAEHFLYHIADGNTYSCPVCERKFTDPGNLRSHLRIHSDEMQFNCKLCNISFEGSEQLEKHKSDKHTTKTAIMDKFIPQALNITDHSKRKVSKKRKRKTLTTKRKSKNLKNRLEVNKVHGQLSSIQMYKEDDSNIPVHDITDTNVVTDPYTNQFHCTFCSKSYASLHRLKWHMTEHLSDPLDSTQKEITMFERPIKNVSLKRDDIYEEDWDIEDLIHKHRKKLPSVHFRCYTCHKEYNSETEVLKHLFSHTHDRIERGGGDKSENIVNIDIVYSDGGELETESESELKFFVCPKCNKQFDTEVDLLAHKYEHTKKKYLCNICQRLFKWQESLNLHLKSHLKEQPFKCHLCSKSFIYRLNLRQHLFYHLNDNIPSLYEGGRQQLQILGDNLNKSEHSLQNNSEISTLEIKDDERNQSPSAEDKLSSLGDKSGNPSSRCEDVYECHICPKFFRGKGELKYHLISHSKEKNFNCHICPKAFKHKSALKRHLVQNHIHTKNSGKFFVCHICNQDFSEVSHLKHHLENHANKKLFQCYTCCKSYKHIFSLRRHYFDEHTERDRFHCKICSETLTNKSDFDSHLEMHLQEKIDCLKDKLGSNKQFSEDGIAQEDEESTLCVSKEDIYKFKERLNGDESSELCYDENVGFKDVYFKNLGGAFTKLMQKLRGPEGVMWRCRICYKTLGNKTHIKRHAISHVDKKLFDCKFCFKKYKSPYTLKKHISFVHKNWKARAISALKEINSANAVLKDADSINVEECTVEENISTFTHKENASDSEDNEDHVDEVTFNEELLLETKDT
ncbi:hypothetical protein SK128_007406, partial [Halocaridina rubra]